MKPCIPLPEAPVKSRRSTADRLRLALSGLAREQATITAHSERSWASITFAGTRHRLKLVFEGADAVQAGELFIAFLPEHEFEIPGQLVADAAITAVDHQLCPQQLQVTCELLLLEET